MSRQGPLKTAGRGIPPVAVSNTSTEVTHTGSWKYIQPAYHDRVAPCSQACPVGIDIQGYMDLLRKGRVAEARQLLLAENPMPAVTGRVCHHPCETACNRGEFDEAVAIHAVERMLGDLIIEEPEMEVSVPRRPERVAVVGSGPAGLACAYHLARLGYGVVVFEAAVEPGGMLRLGIPEYRLPRAILDRDIERIRALGVEIQCGARIGPDVPWWSLQHRFAAVFIAPGAHVSRSLDVPGETGPGVRSGLGFLRAVNRGERPDVGRRVAVVGGGNTAIDCARAALRLGAEVVVLYRRTRAEMPAIADEVAEAEREGVELQFLVAPVAFHAVGGRLSSVACVEMELGEPDASGRRAPRPTERQFAFSVDTVLTAIGEAVDLTGLGGLAAEGSTVRVDELGRVGRSGVFAGGDVTDAARTVADALGAGKRAALGIDRHLRGEGETQLDKLVPRVSRFGPRGNVSAIRWRDADPVSRVAPLNDVVTAAELNLHHFERRPRRPDQLLPEGVGRLKFAEVNRGLSRNAALEEANRCFSCGTCNQCDLCLIFCPDVAITRGNGTEPYRIELDYCKGCGICAAECPRGAIVMMREAL